MSKLKWQRSGSSKTYDIIHQLFDSHGNLVAEVYQGGNKWYPWTWYMRDGSKKHGDSTTMRDAKASAESFYLRQLR